MPRIQAQSASSGANLQQKSLTEPTFGFMLPHEQFRVPELVEFGVAAEKAGFDLVAASDHLQPW